MLSKFCVEPEREIAETVAYFYVTVSDGSDKFVIAIPTSGDVGYKYTTVSDGSGEFVIAILVGGTAASGNW